MQRRLSSWSSLGLLYHLNEVKATHLRAMAFVYKFPEVPDEADRKLVRQLRTLFSDTKDIPEIWGLYSKNLRLDALRTACSGSSPSVTLYTPDTFMEFHQFLLTVLISHAALLTRLCVVDENEKNLPHEEKAKEMIEIGEAVHTTGRLLYSLLYSASFHHHIDALVSNMYLTLPTAIFIDDYMDFGAKYHLLAKRKKFRRPARQNATSDARDGHNSNPTAKNAPSPAENIPPVVENVPPTMENVPWAVENVPPAVESVPPASEDEDQDEDDEHAGSFGDLLGQHRVLHVQNWMRRFVIYLGAKSMLEGYCVHVGTGATPQDELAKKVEILVCNVEVEKESVPSWETLQSIIQPIITPLPQPTALALDAPTSDALTSDAPTPDAPTSKPYDLTTLMDQLKHQIRSIIDRVPAGMKIDPIFRVFGKILDVDDDLHPKELNSEALEPQLQSQVLDPKEAARRRREEFKAKHREALKLKVRAERGPLQPPNKYYAVHCETALMAFAKARVADVASDEKLIEVHKVLPHSLFIRSVIQIFSRPCTVMKLPCRNSPVPPAGRSRRFFRKPRS
jgi:hypothetical protein